MELTDIKSSDKRTLLDAIKQSERLFLVPSEAAAIIGCDPNKIRVTAHQRPELLGFPVCVVGSRVKIPRIPFIQFIEGRNNNE